MSRQLLLYNISMICYVLFSSTYTKVSLAEGVLGLSASELRKDVGGLIICQSEPFMYTD